MQIGKLAAQLPKSEPPTKLAIRDFERALNLNPNTSQRIKRRIAEEVARLKHHQSRIQRRNSSLEEAAERGDIDRLTNILSASPGLLNALVNPVGAPLALASFAGQTCVVRCVLAQPGIDTDTTTATYGYTPVMMAARQGHVEVLNLLLEKKADANLRTMVRGTEANVITANHSH